MNRRRIWAICRRHYYVLKRSPHRWFDVFIWPVVDVLLWGSLGVFVVDQTSEAARAGVTYLLAGILLFHVLYQSQVAASTGFLEETWSRNLLNLMATPLTEVEYAVGVALFGLAKLAVAMVVVCLAALGFFAFSITDVGWGLIPIGLLLLFAGWSISLFVVGLVLRFGQSAEVLAWGILFVVMPLSGRLLPRRGPAGSAGADRPSPAHHPRLRRRPGRARRQATALGRAGRRPPRHRRPGRRRALVRHPDAAHLPPTGLCDTILLRGVVGVVRRMFLGAVVVLAVIGLVPEPAGAGAGDVVVHPFPDVVSLAVDPDGDVWGTNAAGGAVVRFDPDTDTTTSYPAAIGSLPWEIAVGPDGRMWFSSDNSGVIQAVDPDTGLVELITDLAPDITFVEDLVGGPDGRVWITGLNGAGHVIGAYDPTTDDLTTFPEDTVGLASIVVGPEGDLWYADRSRRQIGRIDPVTEEMTSFASPSFRPHHIAAGPGGDIWVVSPFGDYQIGRLDPDTGDGEVVGPLQRFRDIVAGPDGQSVDRERQLRRADRPGDRGPGPLPHPALGRREPLRRRARADRRRRRSPLGRPRRPAHRGRGGDVRRAGHHRSHRRPPDPGRGRRLRQGHDAGGRLRVHRRGGTVVVCTAGRTVFQTVPDGTSLPIDARTTAFWAYARDDAGNTAEVRVQFEAYPLCRGRRATVYPESPPARHRGRT